jgi:hypothetical protein
MRCAVPVVALFAPLVLLCCEQKTARTVPAAAVADEKSAIVIVGDLPLWTLSQGLLEQKETIPIGEVLTLTGQARTASQSGKERDFLGVRRVSGSEGWVRADFTVSRSILSVVTTENAVIYSAPANTCASTESIPRLTIVAVHSDTGGMRFIRVTCFDTSSKLMRRSVYLRNEGVSARPSDVQAAILLQLAAGSKSVTQQKAFLSSALKDYPDSVFAPELQAALDALTAPAPAPAPVPAPAPPPEPSAPGAPQEGAAAPAGSLAATFHA